jgi:hypothetical protein
MSMLNKTINAKRKEILDRIKSLEQDICRAREYLNSGKHADWKGFKPLFAYKLKDGDALPPHKDWVKNVFLPRYEKALRRAEKIIERLEKGKPLGKSRRTALPTKTGPPQGPSI